MKLPYKMLMAVLLAANPASAEAEKRESWDVTCEVFSISLSEAAKLKRAGKTDPEDYREILKRVEDDRAGLEEFLMVRVVNGMTNKVEEITEVIYATEFDPPYLPNDIGNLTDDLEVAKKLITPANPTSFDTENVGTMMEVEVLRVVNGVADLALSLDLVEDLGRKEWGQGPSKVEMSRFAKQTLTSQIEVKLDSPTLVGTISPPASMQPKNGEREVWLAFVTVSKSKD